MNTLIKKYSRKHIGKTFITNEGYTATVIDGGSKPSYCTIQIEDWVNEVSYSVLEKGQVKYPYHSSVTDVGYLGVGKYSRKGYKKTYSIWQAMLKRCYCQKNQIKQPTYIGTKVCEEWHNFQNFAKWHERYYPKDGLKYEIDKDLKSGESKIYSPSTCLFLPRALNVFMANIRSDNKSGYIGVSWGKNTCKWAADITIDGKNIHIGRFKDAKDASVAYQKARKEQVKRWQIYYSFDCPQYVLERLE